MKRKKPVTKCCRTCAWYNMDARYRKDEQCRKDVVAFCSWPCPLLPASSDVMFLPKHAMWPTDGTTCACWAERKRAKP